MTGVEEMNTKNGTAQSKQMPMQRMPTAEGSALIRVVGVGGGGSNAINTMIADNQIQGVDFIAINTDAHVISELENMQYGIYEARRGWVTKEDIINTYPLKNMLGLLKK